MTDSGASKMVAASILGAIDSGVIEKIGGIAAPDGSVSFNEQQLAVCVALVEMTRSAKAGGDG